MKRMGPRLRELVHGTFLDMGELRDSFHLVMSYPVSKKLKQEILEKISVIETQLAEIKNILIKDHADV